ncbi:MULTISPECIES: class I SAM-dependent methyltransferase [Halorussus]|uniref:class I SAM-dependent methyltransferase n=1 Tax=Halorussus TaxID=1070314 RepID=UPI000E2156AA|nr:MULTISPECIES: class I SAM-dependent methyltransferase [Halorussus]NHN58260.1 class I SAM-dependent methyltransferase [Halorussus sp. JP-T4]
MGPTYNFGAYHWRRRFRRIASALALAAASRLLWRRGRSTRPAAILLALAAVWRGYAPVRRLLSPPPWTVEREKYDALGRALPVADADLVVDVGCGTGRSLVGLAPWLPDDATVVGLDVFDSRIILGNGPALARRNAARAGLDVAPVAGDASRLPLGDDTADAVTACRVLHDLPRADAERALAEARRACRPDGVVGVLELPLTHGADADPVDYWRGLVDAAGFDVRRAEPVTGDGAGTEYVVVVAEPGPTAD